MVSTARSSASSAYSSVPSVVTSFVTSHNDSVYRTKTYQFPPRNPVDNFQLSNPYAKSLWYNTRGENGKGAIEQIQERVTQAKVKRKHSEGSNSKGLFLDLSRQHDHSSPKRVDSPIDNQSFSKGFDNIECSSPKYKGLSSVHTETKYRKAFKEIIESEQKYLSDLKIIQDVYRALLSARKYKHILNQSQKSVIFGNIDTIVDLSDLLLADISKKAQENFNESMDVDLKERFVLCDLNKVDIGDIFIDQFNRFKIAYVSYAQNHEAQIRTLRQCQSSSGPKLNKWLDECAYLAKSKSDCWELESLLIKPIQRIAKYPLLIDSLINSLDMGIPIDFVKHLYEAKKTVKQLLEYINCSTKSQSPEGGEFQIQRAPTITSSEKDEYQELVKLFKRQYEGLILLRKETEKSIKPLKLFVVNNKDLAEKWKEFMEFDDHKSPIDPHYIRSIYSSYLERVMKQEEDVKLLIVEYREKVIKAIDLSLEHCSAIRHKINKHGNYKGAYLHYVKCGKASSNLAVSHSLKDAQQYVMIENEIKDELPIFLKHLEELQNDLVLLYTSLTLKWFKILAGSNQIEHFQELLASQELTMGDNFDIIELYSMAKRNTSLALKDMYIRAAELQSPEYDNITSEELRISASKVVRRLFGV